MDARFAEFSCRRANKADVAALAELELATFGEPAYPVFLFRQAIDLWPDYLWVVEHQGALAAYAMLAPHADNLDELSLMSFGIAPTYQGCGLGRWFLTTIQQALIQCRPSLQRVWLTVSPEKTAALRLYAGAGFVESGHEADYYGSDSPRLVLSWWPKSSKN